MFFAFFAALLLVVTLETNAQFNPCPSCPSGYSSGSYLLIETYTDPITLLPAQCTLKIFYCYKLSPTGYLDIQFNGLEAGPCFQYLTIDAAFWRRVWEGTLDNQINNPAMVPCSTLTELTAFITRANCWKIENDVENQVCRLMNCGETGSCQFEYKICLEYNPLRVKKTLVSATSLGSSSCSSTMPPLGYTWNDYWQTICFQYPCE